jgi:hypothetical protein
MTEPVAKAAGFMLFREETINKKASGGVNSTNTFMPV